MRLLCILFLFSICIQIGKGIPTQPPIDSINNNANTVNGVKILTKNPVYRDYLSFENSLYKYHRDPQLWASARKICDAEGGHLVIINSEDEVNFIRGLMMKYPDNVLTDVKYKDQVLIGMHDHFTEGEYVTIDGKSLESSGYNYWEPGQPNTPAQNCGSVTRKGGLNDFPCDIRSTYICEISLKDLCGNNIETKIFEQ